MSRSLAAAGLAVLTCVGALSAVPEAGQAARPAAAPGWVVPRTVDGQPDLQGVWANNNMTPLERPKQFAGRATMTDKELADLKAKVQVLLDGGDAFFFDELVTTALEGKDKFSSGDTQTGNYGQAWLSERSFDNRTSLIIDPPDGRIPPAAPGAAQRARERAAARQGRGPADRAQDLSLGTRCVSFGTPNLMAGYQSYFELTQAPGHAVLRTEMIHDARVIPLDGRPHLSRRIAHYSGDSRGRWDGDTLVVDTTNFSANANFRGSTDGLHLIEKFHRVSADTLEYSVTIDDATVWSRPWTVMIPLKKGVARRLYLHFPLTTIHKFAFKASEAAECAGRQGDYWGMHDALFTNQNPSGLAPASLVAQAASLKLDLARFEKCLGGAAAERVRADVSEGN